jgi:LPS-assembly lipoprotein
MSYFNKRHFLLAGAAFLVSACNFTPAYGPDGAGSKLEGRIFIEAPSNKDTYLLTRRLETRLGRADSAPMTLSVSVSHRLDGLGATATGSSTRQHRKGTLRYTLSNSKTEKKIDSGKISNFVGYSVTGNTATSLAAERASEERLMNVLADQLVDRLLLIDPKRLP